MKLRIKIGSRRVNITLSIQDGCQPTVGFLKEEIRSQIDIENFALSLNGKDTVEGSEDTELSELGLVSGDLITLLVDKEVLEKFVDKPPPKPPAQSLSQQPVEASDCGSVSGSSAVPAPSDSTSNRDVGISEDYSEDSQPSEEDKRKAQEIIDAIKNDPEAICDAEVNRYLNEPVLVRDSTCEKIPQNLYSLYESSNIQSQHDAVCIVLHLLMVETGFISEADSDDMDVEQNRSSVEMPSSWKRPGMYKFQYQHVECPGASFGVTCVPLGAILMVHGTVKTADSQEMCQLKIRSGDFYETAASADQSYKLLPKLSRLFKDVIAYSLLQKNREVMNLPQIFGLTALVTEAKLMILRHLNARSLLNLAQTSHEMHNLCSERSLWRRLYLKDFGRRSNSELNQDWYKHYKEKYILRKQMREQMRRYQFIVPDFMRPRPFPFNPDPFGVGPMGIGPYGPTYPHGFIGGDYDRDPDFSGLLDPRGRRRHQPQPGIFPRPRPRFDPIGPGQEFFRPGRGGGLFGSGRGMGPRFF